MAQHVQAVGSGGVREWMNHNSSVVAIVAALVVAAAIYFAFFGGGSQPVGASEAYFYDPVTKETFGGDLRAIAPIDHNGNKAVRVWYFGCGDCGEKFVGYYEKYTDEAKEAIEAANRPSERELSEDEIGTLNARAEAAYFSGRMVSADGENWVSAQSPEGQKIETAASEKCAGQQLVNCAP